MMLSEARRLLAIDTKVMVEKHSSGPEKVGRFALFRLARRMAKSIPNRAAHRLIQMAVGAKGKAQTHSEIFGFKLTVLPTKVLPLADPEVRRGILFYVCGDEKQHGIAVLALQILNESSGVEVAQRLIDWKNQQLEEMNVAELEVRKRIRSLPPQVRRLCFGALVEAGHAIAEGDERTAYGWFMQIRRLVSMFAPARTEP